MIRWLALALLLLAPTATAAPPQWLALPPTPSLPTPKRSGLAPVNGIQIWYAVFGAGRPVILLHGGLANSNYWGNQVRALERGYQVIVMDSRGHGRSTCDAEPYGYDLMASDVLALMGYLHVRKVAIVGWSDGAIVGLDIAIHHPEEVSKLFAFAANSDPSGVADISKSPVFNAYIARAEREYGRSRSRRTAIRISSLRSKRCGRRSRTGQRPISPRFMCRPGSSMRTMTRRSSARTPSSWWRTSPTLDC